MTLAQTRVGALSSAQFSLCLLGGFELAGPKGRIALTSRKLAALLAFLACTSPEQHSRDRLMTLLWGSHADAQARQNLRQSLTRLRRVLGDDAIVSEGDRLSLRPNVVNCDAAVFLALLKAGSPAALAGAIELYRGPLLPDFIIPEQAWSEWLALHRERIASLALDAMLKQGENELADSHNERAAEMAALAIRFDPLREDAHRLLMRALAADGRRADALKHYEDVAARLKRELAIEPDPETIMLVASLRGQAVARPNDAAPSPFDSELQPVSDRPSIAVLPFANMTGDPAQEYFADGMVDDILLALSRIRWLFVIARQSSFCYKGQSVDVRRVGRELGVRYVVEGGVRKSGNQVRITAQLVNAETGAHIWADRCDGDLRDIFALQDEFTARIVGGLEVNVQAAEVRRALSKPAAPTAYDLYLRALPHYFGQTLDQYDRAEASLRRALEVEADYAEPLGLLVDCASMRTLQGWHVSWARGSEEACDLAARAVTSGPDNSTCLAAASFTYGVLAGRFDESLDLATQALKLHPNSVLVRHRVAAVFTVCGESDRAVENCEAARRMNPLDSRKAATSTYGVLSTAHYFARRFEESLEAGRRTLALAPSANNTRKYVAMSLAQLGRVEEARLEIAALTKYQPGASMSFFRQSRFRHPWMHELHLEGLRKAGVQDS